MIFKVDGLYIILQRIIMYHHMKWAENGDAGHFTRKV